jgi:hypothetical protein
MSFRKYIENRRVRDNTQGDFVRDARGDSRMPENRAKVNGEPLKETHPFFTLPEIAPVRSCK